MMRKRLVLMGVVLLVGVGCSSGAGSEASTQTATATPVSGTTPNGEASPSVAEMLDAIVLPESDPPSGTEFVQWWDGVSAATQPVQDSAPEVQLAVQEGWVDALSREFWTPKMLEAVQTGPDAIQNYSKHFDRSGNWMVGSWASAYEDAESAAAALDVFLQEFRTSWKLKHEKNARLGDVGTVFSGSLHHPIVPVVLYMWRTGPYLLHILATGSVKADADTVRVITEGMQAQAATAE